MCTKTAMTASTDTTPTPSLQTLDRVKNYKVVGQVSSYARGLAEGSNIFNQYIAPISTKGLEYVPDVSSYVPTKYVAKVDSLGVNCLERIENVSDYVHKLPVKMLPVEEDDTEEQGEERECQISLKQRLYVNSKKQADWVSSGVSGAVTDVTARVTKTVSPVSTKIQETISPVKTKVNSIIKPVTSRVTALVEGTKQTVASVKKTKEELTYAKVADFAVASSSQVLLKTKKTTLAYVPSAYRDSVEDTVSSTEQRVVALWKRLPTAEEVRSVDKEQLKQALSTAVVTIKAKAVSPLYYISSKLHAPFVKTPTPGAETPKEDDAPDAVCEDEAPAPNAEALSVD